MCCLPYHNGPQNFTINFDNDQSNDQLTIYLSENALKGKYKLTLKNGAGRSQLVQYSIYRIDSGGEVRQLNFYFILALIHNQILNLYLKVWDYMSYKLRIHKVLEM